MTDPDYPLPVTSIPSPANPGYFERPAVISAIGVLCIIVAAICLVGGGFSSAINLFMAYHSSSQVLQGKVPIMSTTTAVNPAENLGPGGLAAPGRAAVIDGLSRVRVLSNGQRNQLDEMLALDGDEVCPVDGPTASPDGVERTVSDSGHLGDEDHGTDWFTLGRGRLELTDERAVFFPTDGGPPVRTNAVDVPPRMEGAVTPPLSADQVRSVLRVVARDTGTRVKSPQAKALADLLQNPGEQLIVPTTDGSDPSFEITDAKNTYNGDLEIHTAHDTVESQITITPEGAVNNSSTVPAFKFNVPKPKLNRTAALLTGGLSVLNLLLAILLLVTGIFVLRQSFRGKTLLWTYIGLKLPIGLGAFAAGYWMWSVWIKSVTDDPTATSGAVDTAVMFSIPPLIGCIFPLVMIGVMRLPGVRKYYSEKVAMV